MLEKSSNSVKVVFADKNKVLHQLADYTVEVKRSRPEVEKVGLFGSYATGTYGPASDVDLLIILRQSSKRFLDRIPDYLPDNLSVSCDVFPYTDEEIEKTRQEEAPWIYHVLKEVVWL
ncbi:MAG TPA: nucleotidyltransferase domain-containing protein [Sedimentisphaerales bacterium]|nr:nucleotidyltransferase domain-containing protein [Sedimentisphaerales bacterium]